jgi:hypothetical protein
MTLYTTDLTAVLAQTHRGIMLQKRLIKVFNMNKTKSTTHPLSLQKPSKLRTLRPFPQLLRRNIPRA